MNSTNTTTTFFVNQTTPNVKTRNDGSVCISIEEFEDLMEYKRVCKSIFEMFGELLDLEEMEE